MISFMFPDIEESMSFMDDIFKKNHDLEYIFLENYTILVKRG